MQRYIAFLRGINLGKRRLAMSRLKALFEKLGFRDVETFIASGNVLFSCKATDTSALESRIAKHLHASLGYEVDTSVTPLSEQLEDRGPDFRSAPQHPYRPARDDVARRGDLPIVEIPVSVALTRRVPRLVQSAYVRLPRRARLRGLLSRDFLGWIDFAWLYPARFDLELMRGAARTLVEDGASVLNVFLHSSELVDGLSGRVRDGGTDGGPCDETTTYCDGECVDVAVDVVTGSPAERIVDAADDAGMLVIGSRGCNPLVPESLDPVTARALRHSRCGILSVREVHVDLEANEAEIARLADACRVTWQLIEDNRAAEALPFIEPAAQRALWVRYAQRALQYCQVGDRIVIDPQDPIARLQARSRGRTVRRHRLDHLAKTGPVHPYPKCRRR